MVNQHTIEQMGGERRRTKPSGGLRGGRRRPRRSGRVHFCLYGVGPPTAWAHCTSVQICAGVKKSRCARRLRIGIARLALMRTRQGAELGGGAVAVID
uniref:Uncharacterized protein n=1 Tax=Rhipicephalus zambeziensis TaxID=60191 RepID=A0A224Y4V1_9ACAR